MTTWRQVLHVALDALELPSGTSKPVHGSQRAIARVDGGTLVELLSEPATACPHCGKALPQPRTRTRRLVRVVAGSGKVLAVEIE